jgi:hypothetical protein
MASSLSRSSQGLLLILGSDLDMISPRNLGLVELQQFSAIQCKIQGSHHLKTAHRPVPVRAIVGVSDVWCRRIRHNF